MSGHLNSLSFCTWAILTAASCGTDERQSDTPWKSTSAAIEISLGGGMPGPDDGDDCTSSTIRYEHATASLYRHLCSAGLSEGAEDLTLTTQQQQAVVDLLLDLKVVTVTSCFEDASSYLVTIVEQSSATKNYRDDGSICNGDATAALDREQLDAVWSVLSLVEANP